MHMSIIDSVDVVHTLAINKEEENNVVTANREYSNV
jgi:hypothetical protein